MIILRQDDKSSQVEVSHTYLCYPIECYHGLFSDCNEAGLGRGRTLDNSLKSTNIAGLTEVVEYGGGGLSWREGGRKRGRKEERERGREGERKGGREGGRKRGRKEEREEEMEGDAHESSCDHLQNSQRKATSIVAVWSCRCHFL